MAPSGDVVEEGKRKEADEEDASSRRDINSESHGWRELVRLLKRRRPQAMDLSPAIMKSRGLFGVGEKTDGD